MRNDTYQRDYQRGGFYDDGSGRGSRATNEQYSYSQGDQDRRYDSRDSGSLLLIPRFANHASFISKEWCQEFLALYGYSMSASDQYRDAGAGYDEPSRIGRLSSRGTYTPVPPKGAEDSVFSRPIGDDYYRDNSSRQSVRDRPPSSSYNRGQSDQYEHRDGHRRRDYDSREEMSNSRGSSNSYRSTGSAGNNRDLRDEREFVGSREDVATPVIDVADNRSLSLSNRTSLPGDSNLSEEVRTCLRIIRDFAFVHRNATSCGFKTIESIISHLPGGHNADYWIQLINQHLSEVEVVLFRKSEWNRVSEAGSSRPLGWQAGCPPCGARPLGF
ncbi:unnamed protein product [Nippostrongylus brasiliensis]|uniref:Periphilin-1 n=1 Tax=Nippostrongylus brasiliensis TaxID=27835 RepID=A0A0N4YRE7_NIPBR|nr:unnamed protein product [Nippostrongylus brasiliensis]